MMGYYKTELWPALFGGTGTIRSGASAGLTVAGVGAQRKIYLLDDNAFLLYSVWSKPDGSFQIDGLKIGVSLIIMARDYAGQFNAVIRDNITPAPMT